MAPGLAWLGGWLDSGHLAYLFWLALGVALGVGVGEGVGVGLPLLYPTPTFTPKPTPNRSGLSLGVIGFLSLGMVGPILFGGP